MVTPPVAALDATTRTALGTIAEHLRGALDTSPGTRWEYAERLPRIGRKAAIRALDAKLQLATLHAHQAVALLDDLGHPALAEVRIGAAGIAKRHEERVAIVDRAERWEMSRPYQTDSRTVRSHASALEAVAKDESSVHLSQLARAYGTDNRDVQRLLTRLDPRVAHVAPWIPSNGAPSSHGPWMGNVIEPLAGEAGDSAEAVRQAWWMYLRSRVGVQMGSIEVAAGDMRRMYDAASDAFAETPHPAPAWLVEPADDAVLRLEPVDLMELYARMRGGDAKANALTVAHSLTTSLRHELAWGTDWGKLTIEGMRRLPAEVRPHVPANLADDADAALRWARELRERAPRAELAESTAFPAQQVYDVLWNDGKTAEGAIGRSRVALELVEAIEPQTEGGRQVHALLLDRLRQNAEAFETGWHVEYTDHGRAIALAETFAAVERSVGDDVARISDQFAADADRVVASPPDRLNW